MTEGDSPFTEGLFLPRLFLSSDKGVVGTAQGLRGTLNSVVTGERAKCITADPPAWLFALSGIRQVSYDFSCTD